MGKDTIRTQIEKDYLQNYCGCILCQLCNKKIYRTRNALKPCCKLDSEDMQKQSDNLCEYLGKVVEFIDQNKSPNNPKPIKLAIVGKDPYPTDPIGIPFAKNSIKDMNKTASGKPLLRGLGIEEKYCELEASVLDLYDLFLQNGIVFLNILYKYIGREISVKNDKPYLDCANSINHSILEFSAKIVLCGEAFDGFKIVNGDNDAILKKKTLYKVYHPSARKPKKPNQNASQKEKAKWNAYQKNYSSFWGKRGALINRIELDSNGVLHKAIENINNELSNLLR